MLQDKLSPAPGSKKDRKRVGRGDGSGRGTYSGRLVPSLWPRGTRSASQVAQAVPDVLNVTQVFYPVFVAPRASFR